MKIETKFNVGDIVAIRREHSIYFIQIKRVEVRDDVNGTEIIYYSMSDARFIQTEVFSLEKVGLLKDSIVLEIMKQNQRRER